MSELREISKTEIEAYSDVVDAMTGEDPALLPVIYKNEYSGDEASNDANVSSNVAEASGLVEDYSEPLVSPALEKIFTLSPKEAMERQIERFKVRKDAQYIREEFGSRRVDQSRLVALKKVGSETDEDSIVIANLFNPDELIQRHMDYIVETRDVEVDTKKALLLTGIAQKMSEGYPEWEDKVRVVIMKRGQEFDAHVTADGTIFLSQSLINELDSVDEIGAIIAHEMGHLIHNTSELKSRSDVVIGFGIEWLHEFVADTGSKNLLEQARLNSTAFVSAGRKLLGTSRGIVHQAGVARGAQVNAQHGLIDSETSDKDDTQLPEYIRTSTVDKTNMEIAFDAMKNRDTKMMSKLIYSLHPKDYQEVYEQINARWGLRNVGDRFRTQTIKLLDTSVRTRLREKEFDDDEISYMLIGRHSESAYEKSTYLIHSLDNLHQGIDAAVRLASDSEKYLINIKEGLLGSERIGVNVLEDYITNIDHKGLFKRAQHSGEGLVFASQDDFKELLTHLNDAIVEIKEVNGGAIHGYAVNIIFERLLTSYITTYHYEVSTGESVEVGNEEALRELLVWIKDSNIPFNNYLKGSLYKYGGEFESDSYVDEIQDLSDEVLGRTTDVITFRDRFEQFISSDTEFDSGRSMENIYWDLQSSIKKGEMGLDDTLDLAREYRQRIREVDFEAPVSLLDVIAGEVKRPEFTTEEESKEALSSQSQQIKEENRYLYAMFKEVAFSLAVLDVSSSEFYDYLETTFADAPFDWETLSDVQILNSLNSLFSFHDGKHEVTILGKYRSINRSLSGSISGSKVFDLERLNQLEPFRVLSKRNQEREFEEVSILNPEEILLRVEEKRKKLYYYNLAGSSRSLSASGVKNETRFFDDSLMGIFHWDSERRILSELFDVTISMDHYPALADLVGDEIDGASKRRIQYAYLHSDEISLEEKVSYVKERYEELGPESLFLIGDMIADIDTYKSVRAELGDGILQQAIEGSMGISKLAGADLLSSVFAEHAHELFATTASSVKDKATSTAKYAKQWFDRHTGRAMKPLGISYDTKSHSFVVGRSGLSRFKSFSDMVNSAHHMPSGKRMGLAFKALTEENGALDGEENRDKLGNDLVVALDISDELQRLMLKSTLSVAEADLVSFPAAQMLGGLLFRSLDMDYLDVDAAFFDKSRGSEEYKFYAQNALGGIGAGDASITKAELERILTLSTRDLLGFGDAYAHQPNSFQARETSKIKLEYDALQDRIGELFEESELQKGHEEREGSSNRLDVLLKGLESSGATVVRQMQLSTQFYKFAESTHKRLSKSLDQNPGMSKLAAWENMYLWSTPRNGDSPERIQEKLEFSEYLLGLSVGEKVGGGSLNTVFAAEEKGAGVKVALRLQNPNAAYFVEQSHKLVNDAYDELLKRGGRKYSKVVKIGKMLNDMARRWCLRDINDPHYIEDNERFAQVIDLANNMSDDSVEYYATEARFTQAKIKSERFGKGTTANQFLQSDVSEEDKRRVVNAITSFYDMQVSESSGELFLDESAMDYLVHSDQHAGNFLVEFDDNGTLHLGVIDRNMFLRLEDSDIKVIRLQSEPGKEREFVEALVERVLDVNKVRGNQRKTTLAKVFQKMMPEYVRQYIRKEPDQLALMQRLFEAVALQDLDVPLELQMMIRNAGARQALENEYFSEES